MNIKPCGKCGSLERAPWKSNGKVRCVPCNRTTAELATMLMRHEPRLVDHSRCEPGLETMCGECLSLWREVNANVVQMELCA